MSENEINLPAKNKPDPSARTSLAIFENCICQLEELKRVSSVFDFETNGDAQEFVVTFHGKGLSGRQTSDGSAEVIDVHQVLIGCHPPFPQKAPQLKWKTRIAHPNISLSGIFQLDDVGIIWDEQMSLVVVCERLWDMARLAHINWDHVVNNVARDFVRGGPFRLPVDSRVIRDRAALRPKNLVYYRSKYRRPEDHSTVVNNGDHSTIYITDKPPLIDSKPVNEPAMPHLSDTALKTETGIKFID